MNNLDPELESANYRTLATCAKCKYGGVDMGQQELGITEKLNCNRYEIKTDIYSVCDEWNPLPWFKDHWKLTL